MRIVFTGGPCTGKTTLVKELNKLGYKTIDEPAREILSEYEKNKPHLHPKLSKDNRNLFQKEVETRNFENFIINEHGFFDRSPVDEIGFRNYYNKKISKDLQKFCNENRYDLVFFFPFWEEIYTKDSIRKETSTQSRKIGESILNAYIEKGYEPYIVPKLNIKLRLDYILNNIKK